MATIIEGPANPEHAYALGLRRATIQTIAHGVRGLRRATYDTMPASEDQRRLATALDDAAALAEAILGTVEVEIAKISPAKRALEVRLADAAAIERAATRGLAEHQR